MGTKTTRTAHRALAAAAALLALLALAGDALAAGTSSNFSVRRVQSLPSGALVAFGPLGQVASALNYGGVAGGPGFFPPGGGTHQHPPLALSRPPITPPLNAPP